MTDLITKEKLKIYARELCSECPDAPMEECDCYCMKKAIYNALSEALQEREERERGCKECTEQFVQGKTFVEYVADGKYNFCPMCGRPLKTAMPGEEV